MRASAASSGSAPGPVAPGRQSRAAGWSNAPSISTITPDGSAVLFLRAKPRFARLGLFEFDVASGKTREMLTPEQVLKGAEEKLIQGPLADALTGVGQLAMRRGMAGAPVERPW